MRLLAKSEAEIHSPVDEVFAYVSNLENFGAWFPGVVAIQSGNDIPHGQVGKEYLETLSLPLRGPRKVRVTVREVRPGRLFVTEGSLSPLLPRMEISFSESGSHRTHLRWRMDSRSANPVVQGLLVPLARRLMQKRADIAMRRLKQRLESP
jgi:carbon monoxide dehydrogenase subunit G